MIILEEKVLQERMKIGIDFDGVLFDSERMFQEHAVVYANKHNLGGAIRPNELRAQKRYDWPAADMAVFIAESTPFIENNASVMPNAKRVLKELSKNHELVAITGRKTPESIERTNQRLKAENIVFDKVIYAADDKLEVCRNLGIELMIEDYYDEVERLSSNGIECFYYNEFTSKSFQRDNVFEVHNWAEIREELKKRGMV